jgi:hypothetical protein
MIAQYQYGVDCCDMIVWVDWIEQFAPWGGFALIIIGGGLIYISLKYR